MTRSIFLALGMMLLTFSAAAQDAMPTKEETVNYIHKKMQEVIGFQPFPNEQKWKRMTFRMSDENIICEITKEYPSHPELFVFNPRHIKSVVVGNPRDGRSTAYIGVTFLKSTLRSAAGGTELRIDSIPEPFINIPYLATVPGNGDRIAKALLHLRDLAKAEDELF
jgi:hypothetical protein